MQYKTWNNWNKSQCHFLFSIKYNTICYFKFTFNRLLSDWLLYCRFKFDKSWFPACIIALQHLTLSAMVSETRDTFFNLFVTRVDHTLFHEIPNSNERVWNTRACINIASTCDRKRDRARAGRMLFVKPLWRDTCVTLRVIVAE